VTDAVLRIDRVSVSYGATVALHEISVAVHAGELFGLLGAPGAGKTTAMRVALGVLAPDSGAVRWKSRPITPADRRQIGYLPEHRGLYPRMRLADQLCYLAELRGLPAHRARRASESWMDRLDLRQYRAEPVRQLRPSDQQRAQLAAALVAEPAALVLDEPFAGLDSAGVDLLGHVLRERAEAGVPVLFSSATPDLVDGLCDRVGVIQNGQMVATGTVTELRRQGPVIVLVDAPEADPGWASALPGCRVRSVDGSRTVLELAEGTDDQMVLRAAQETGPVREFSRRRAALAEIFRESLAVHRRGPGGERRGWTR
jgi:ABC-2 type transport system ATP-binding protein